MLVSLHASLLNDSGGLQFTTDNKQLSQTSYDKCSATTCDAHGIL